jgi:ferredoxin-NADP reductase/Na+-translocating ferredoxin:NAD+ oxidoreductase RnfD subunit
MRAAATWLDSLTGRVTMYRLVLLGLLVVLAESIVVSLLGKIAYQPLPILVSAAVAVAATVISSRLIGLIFRVKPHTESAIVTGLILAFLFTPLLTATSIGWLAVAAVIASASKFVLAYRGRHVFNPAAVAAVVMSIAVPSVFPSWWVGAPWILPVVVICAFVILHRTRHLTMGIVFFAVATAVVALTSVSNGATSSMALQNALLSSPVVFFAGFMLSEPLTLPPRRWQQLALAVVVGVVFGVPFHVGPVYGTYELALVIGNLLAFFVGQRRGIRLALASKRQLTPTTWELAFTPRKPVRFSAGQFMELSLPHARADVKGQRRVFSIASAGPDPAVVRFGLTTSTPSSSFKTALLALEPGAEIAGTSVGGDFTLPRDGATPLLFVAGGIGITPFISHLEELRAASDTRDVVLVYSVASASGIAYRDELEALGVPVVLLAPTAPADLPAGWTYAGSGRIDEHFVAASLADAARRHAYVSGPPRLVHSVRQVLRRSGVRRVTTDAFSGY